MTRLELRKVKHVQKIEMGDTPLTIGRSSSNDVVLEDTHVSRKHCVLERRGDGAIRVRDLGSHGGTYLNGGRINEGTLHPGDRISIGPFDVLYRAADGAMPANHHAESELTLAAVDSGEWSTIALTPEQRNGKHAPSIIHRDAAFVSADQDAESRDAAANLEQRQAELDRRAADLHEREAALERRLQHPPDQPDATEALRRTIQTLEAQLTNAQQGHQEAVGDLERARNRINELNQEALQSAARLQELHATNRASQERLAQLEGNLVSARQEIERLRTHEATLQEQADAFAASQRALAQEAEDSTHAMTLMRGQIQALDDAARKVSALQERLVLIESAWVEIDEQMQTADEEDAQLLESVALQRHQISDELESLSRLRDDAITQLSESAQQLRAASERHTMRMPPALSIAAPHRTERAERRWWKFGKSG